MLPSHQFPSSSRSRFRQLPKESKHPLPTKDISEKNEEEGIAIVGVFGRYPQANTLDDFWNNLRSGKDSIIEIPLERWDWRLHFDKNKKHPQKTYSKWGSFIQDCDKFDPSFFNISPREAERMDPQERLLLEASWGTLEDAGYAPHKFHDFHQGEVGVFVGVMWNEYALLQSESQSANLNNSSLANRISYYFNFSGPSLVIDTACSSSLVAVHMACESIRRGEVQCALTGGVNLSLHPSKYITLSQMKMLSSEGKCQSFGAGGDGYVPGEGIGMVLLKPLSKALQNKDNIYGVLLSSHVNHGGKTNGYTVPNPDAHAALIQNALSKGKLPPQSISYIEAHGTGTALGDPVETTGLCKAFENSIPKQSCPIGSVKSNIGHLEGAAGIAALTKVLLQLKHKQLVPSLHSANLNPHIDFEKTPFYVQQELTDWQPKNGFPRRAGVSSFGAGGTNAHVILEEAPKQIISQQHTKPFYLVTLSAKHPTSLKQHIKNIYHYLRIHSDLPLDSLAYNLNTGRSHFNHRCAMVVANLKELKTCLEKLEKNESQSGCFIGQSEKALEDQALYKKLLQGILEDLKIPPPVNSSAYKDNLEALASLYVKGYDLNWEILQQGENHQKISLPTYPFLKEHYWVPLLAPELKNSNPPFLKQENISSELKLQYYYPDWANSPLEKEYTQVIKSICVFSDEVEFVAALRKKIGAIPIIHLCSTDDNQALGDYNYQIKISEKESYSSVLKDLQEKKIELSHIIFNRKGKEPILAFKEIVVFVQSLIKSKHTGSLRGLCLSSLQEGPAFEALELGFVKSLCREYPAYLLQVMRYEKNLDEKTLVEKVHQEWHASVPDATAIRYSEGIRQIERYQEAKETEKHPLPLRQEGVYLVTGGLGGIGFFIAQYLVENFRAKLVLTGRSPLDAAKEKQLQILYQLGGQACYLEGDIADLSSVENWVREAKAKFGALHGIIHSAGVLQDGLLVGKSWETFEKTLAPKVMGTVHLDAVTKHEPLECFVLFSSIISCLGNVGQSDYASGNAFLDSFASWRKEQQATGNRQGKTLSINWPLWQEGGMQPDVSGQKRYQDSDVSPLPTKLGLKAFEHCLQSPYAQIAVCYGKSSQFLEQIKSIIPKNLSPFLSSNFNVEQRKQEILKEIRLMAAELIKLSFERIEPAEHLSTYGFDSILYTEFSQQLNEHYKIETTPTIFYTYSSLSELTDHLFASYNISSAVNAPSTKQQASHLLPLTPSSENSSISPSQNEPIAIIGMAGLFPQADNLEEFWQHLEACADLITEVPSERWDWKKYYSADPQASGKSISKWGGFIRDVDKFDAAFFHISPREAELMDPQHRLFLQTVWHSLEDAGYAPETTSGQEVGLFVGVQFNEYGALAAKDDKTFPSALLTGTSHAMLANRISYLLNWHGPSEAMDTACSSSLVALNRAVKALRAGECEKAVAGGISLMLQPETLVYTSQLGVLSPSGRCKTFDANADGFVKGEGAGAIVLKTLSAALRDKDQIHGLILSTAVNHGGKAQSLTAPNAKAQCALLVKAYEQANISPETVTYIETHGTGTKLGDPVEIEALKQAFTQLSPNSSAKSYCALGSVKGNVGHLEPAAGIAGVLKVLLAMSHKKMPGLVHYKQLNPYIQVEGSPFYIAAETQAWEQTINAEGKSIPRRAGISSFGFGGANAHVVLEEPPMQTSYEAASKTCYLVTLSAKHPDSLKQRITDLQIYLSRHPDMPLSSIAYNLNVGRSHFSYRCALVASHLGEIQDYLNILQQGQIPTSCFKGQNEKKSEEKDAINRQILEGNLKKLKSLEADSNAKERREILEALANLYVKGYELDWNLLHQGESQQKISLPTYPFLKKRHWYNSYQTSSSSTSFLEPNFLPASKAINENKEIEVNNASLGNLTLDARRLMNDIVDIKVDDAGVALISLQDKVHKNQLTKDLLYTLEVAFKKLQDDNRVKTIVVTGYGELFCLGGTEEGLKTVASKEMLFTEIPFVYQGFLSCSVPVIAAMQGHAFGAGLTLGLFADMVVMSESHIYTANYMKYGFTPGVGSTFILKEKLTPALAHEMMWTAQDYTGFDLKARGAQVTIVPAGEVLPEALRLAHNLAKKPREALQIFKQQMAKPLLAQLPHAIEQELAMHAEIFAKPDALNNITTYFDKLTLRKKDSAAIAVQEEASGAIGSRVLPSAGSSQKDLNEVIAELSTIIADKLHFSVSEVSQSAKFSELGLDSVASVEIMRKVNRHFSLNLEAVTLYDYPTIESLANHIVTERKTNTLVLESFQSAPKPLGKIKLDNSQQGLNEVIAELSTIIADKLHFSVSEVSQSAKFSELGLDSVASVEIMRKVNQHFSLNLEAVTLYDYPTIESLANHIVTERKTNTLVLESFQSAPKPLGKIKLTRNDSEISKIQPTAPPGKLTSFAVSPVEKVLPSSSSAFKQTEVAVIGMAGRFPSAKDLEAFWSNLRDGKCSITKVPESRWQADEYFSEIPQQSGKSYSKWGGFLSGADLFDPAFFRISPAEAEQMDPQQRLFLEECWHALEDAGYSTKQMAGKACGVFVGVAAGDYHSRVLAESELTSQQLLGGSPSILAARISYLLDLTGPAIAMDTSCSSSLVALHQACQSLILGECEMALAGGVSVLTGPALHIMTSNAGMLSRDGKCKTFDNSADGFVPAEGVGVVVLKPLHKALHDKDHIYGVIKGSGMNQDGATNGITAPSARSQEQLHRSIYKKYGINPGDISYIEAHGTGTKLGDPIEVRALIEAFKEHNTEKNDCALGSVKSNIGHALAAAGIASVIKVLLCLKHKELVPSLHFSEPNEHIDFSNSPFYVNTKLKAWEQRQNSPRLAAISSFGFSGTNAHVVIEEGPKPNLTTGQSKPSYLITLSAKHPDSLKQRIVDLHEHLKRYSHLSLGSLSYNLNVGRSHFPYRCAVVTASIEELKGQLATMEQGQMPAGCFKEQAEKTQEDKALYRQILEISLEKLQTLRADSNVKKYQEVLEALANLYVKGYEIDWNLLHQGESQQKISLPAYPFLRKSYWLRGDDHLPSPVKQRQGSPSIPVLHPLVGQNASTLEGICYETALQGESFYLVDHIVEGQKVLPGVCYLEMARAGGALAYPSAEVCGLKDIVWSTPIVVDEKKQIYLFLLPEAEQVFYEVRSKEGAEVKVHCQGELVYGTVRPSPNKLDLATLQHSFKKEFSRSELYERSGEATILSGPSFQGLQWAKYNEKQAFAYLVLPKHVCEAKDYTQYLLHPSFLDSVLQTAAVLSLKMQEEGAYLLFTVEQMEWFVKELPAKSYVLSELDARSTSAMPRYQVQVCNEDGEIILEFKGVTTRKAGGQEVSLKQAASLAFYKPILEEISLTSLPEDKTPLTGLLAIHASEKERRQLQTALRCEVVSLSQQDLQQPERLAQKIATLPATFSHFLYLVPQESRNSEPNLAVEQLFVLTQALVSSKKYPSLEGWYVCREDGRHYPFAEMAKGFILSIGQELPHYRYRFLSADIESGLPQTDVIDSWLKEIHSLTPTGTIIRYKGNKRYQEKFQSIVLPNGGNLILPFKQKGIYLITGGLGGLGFLFARYLAQHYQAKLILTGRSQKDELKAAKLSELEALGSEVLYVKSDISQESAVQKLLEEGKKRFGSLQGIIHSAGILKDSLLIKKSLEDFCEVLAPKVKGIIHLDKFTAKDKLDFFISFSSVASLLGNIGQTDYASANAFLDSFSLWRDRQVKAGERSGKTLSINWPLWAEGGMRVDEASQEYLENALGISPLPTEKGFEAFEQLLNLPSSQGLVLYGEASRLIRLDRISNDHAPQQTATRILGSLADEKLLALIEEDLLQQVSGVLKIPREDLNAKEDLRNYGFDSISFTKLASQCSRFFNVRLTPAHFFEFSSIKQCASHLMEHESEKMLAFYQARQSFKQSPAETNAATLFSYKNGSSKQVLLTKAVHIPDVSPRSHLNATSEGIAIIGMQGIFPGAQNLEEFWQQLCEGKDAIQEVPRERWDWRTYEKEGVPKWGGFIGDIDKFDAPFFTISPREAELMDPQQRLFLQIVWQTMEDAGYTQLQLSRYKTGVFVGVSGQDYGELLQRQGLHEAHAPTGLAHSILANRVSYLLNLTGPSEAIDTACSSSLVALHHAVRAIQAGDCELAFVGSVNALLSPSIFISLVKAGMLSPDGRCQTFDKRANGYVRSEGVGAILLKPLSKALEDNDLIYGVIKETSVNHGGQVSSLTVPNPNAQADLIIQAYKRGGIVPQSVSYIETHGTGTSLGDPIEINGLKKAFQTLSQGPKLDALPYCALGSVKANIGHLEAAAGIAGLIKVLCMLKHSTIPKQANYENLNPHIDLDNSPFYIADKTQVWETKEGIPRRAGVSSFGAGGANAHALIEEAPKQIFSQAPPKSYYLVTLSTKHQSSLKQRISSLHNYLKSHSDLSLEAVAYTLNARRDHFSYRTALVVSNLEELKTYLSKLEQGKPQEGCFTGQTEKAPEDNAIYKKVLRGTLEELRTSGINSSLYKENLEALANLYVKGYDLDWDLLHQNESHQKVTLPTYAFLKQRYWLPEENISVLPGSTSVSLNQIATALHPLLGQNVSTLESQCYKTILQADKFYLNDHVVQGRKILPGVCALEMARIAGELSSPSQKVSGLKDIVWLSPIIVEKAKDIFLHLILQGEQVQFEIRSKEDGKDILHSQGKLMYGEPRADFVNLDINIAILENSLPQTFSKSELYAIFKGRGLLYGPSFQGLEWIKTDGKRALGFVKLPYEKVRAQDFDAYLLHPSFLDAVLQAGAGLNLETSEGEKTTHLPFGLDELKWFVTKLPEKAYVLVEKEERSSMQLHKYRLQVMDEKGAPILQIKGAYGRKLEKNSYPSSLNEQKRGEPLHHQAQLAFYKPEWQEQSLAELHKSTRPLTGLLAFGISSEECKQLQTKLGCKVVEFSSAGVLEPKNLSEGISRLPPDISHLLFALQHKNEQNFLAVEQLFSLTQALLKSKRFSSLEGWVLFPTGDGYPLAEMANGFVKSLAQEHPYYKFHTFTYLDNVTETELIELWLAEIRHTQRAGATIRYVTHKRFVEHFVKIDTLQTSNEENPPFQKKGVYLITGGLGGLGFLFARHLAKHFQAKLILTGRSALDETKKKQLIELEKIGGDVLYLQRNITQKSEVENLLAEGKIQFGALSGILHAAGVLKDSFLTQKSLEDFKAVLAPKVQGLIHLDEATKDEKLDCFILFSSIASILGNVGQCDYASANAFLDSFAQWRQRQVESNKRSGKTLSLNWPLWLEGGMQVDAAGVEYMEASFGIKPLPTHKGFEAFDQLLNLPLSQGIVLYGDPRGLKRFEQIQESTGAVQTAPVIIPLANENLQEWLLADLMQLVSKVLKISLENLRTDEDLSQYGFDSITFTQLTTCCNQLFGIHLTPAHFFEFSTLAQCAEFLLREESEKIQAHYQPKSPLKSVLQTAPVIIPLANENLQEWLLADLMQLVSKVLKISLENLRTDEDLSQYGFDSITFTQLTTCCNQLFGIHLTPAHFFEFSTLAQCAEFLLREESEKIQAHYQPKSLPKNSAAPSEELTEKIVLPSQLRAVKQRSSDFQDIAIIGMQAILPGAKYLEEFWQNLLEGKDAIQEIPAERWDWRTYEKEGVPKWGGFIGDIDKFDPFFFSISPREAEFMDPQQRLFLQVVWQAMEDAGYSQEQLSQKKTGLFVGVSGHDYAELLQRGGTNEAYAPTGLAHSILANRVSYLLNLTGPSEAIDTACSSSLVALHHAVRAIQAGDCELAFVGGVNALLSPSIFISFAKAGMLSPDGKCKTFDERANGYVRGEGLGALLLKPLSQALEDGNHIYGVIKGSSVNHGGHVNTLTTPNPKVQAELIKDIFQRSRIAPESISYIEAHGTGTSLGDPIEINALKKAFQSSNQGQENLTSPSDQYCAIGSVKANIGHLEAAAGIAGIVKVLFMLKYKTIPPQANFEVLNPYIKLAGSPFYIAEKVQAWETKEEFPRRAGISSFGFGGANAHVVIEEAPQNPYLLGKITPYYLVTLSAKHPDSLTERIGDLHHYLKNQSEVSLESIAYTLNSGRSHFHYRCAIVAADLKELTAHLEKLKQGETPPECFRGQAENERSSHDATVYGELLERVVNELATLQSTDKLQYRKNLNIIASLYIKGHKIDWELLHNNDSKQKVSLPSYPFLKQRYWLPVSATPHQNSIDPSTLRQQELTFTDFLELIKTNFAATIKVSPEQIDIHAELKDYGLDSVVVTEMASKLENAFGKIEATLFFSARSIHDLSTRIYEHYGSCPHYVQAKDFAQQTIEQDSHKKILAEEGIAIIGLSGRYPCANDLYAFYENLKAGKDLIEEVPKTRWDYTQYYSEDSNNRQDKNYAKWGSFIHGVNSFDYEHFKMSFNEALAVHPEERLLLEEAWHCFESAGYNPLQWLDQKENGIGVYIGASFHDYQQLIAAANQKSSVCLPFTSQTYSYANRLSYYFNLTGPSVVLDTACSSSLFAMHEAFQALREGRCNMALAGGANLNLHPSKYISLSQFNFLAKDGKCHAFTEGGTGYVPGEGVGLVLLKRLTDAVRDQDNILAVIKGAAAGNDGRTNGFTVPDPDAQSRVIAAALKQACLSAKNISFVECHGTGTQLGDPIEIAGLTQVFSQDTPVKQYCAVSSVKSNIGHLEAAAGIAQVTKVTLQMQSKQLFPNVMHGKHLNKRIQFAETPFYVQDRLSPWEANNTSRYAGISSFGAGGTNVHLILEGYEKPPKTTPLPQATDYVLIPFSADTEGQLLAGIDALYKFLNEEYYKIFGSEYSASNIAGTLQQGRAARSYRLAFVCSSSFNDLLKHLEEIIANYHRFHTFEGKENIFFSKSTANTRSSHQIFISNEQKTKEDISYPNLINLALAWTQGKELNWHYISRDYQKIFLPGYNFKQKLIQFPENNITTDINKSLQKINKIDEEIYINIKGAFQKVLGAFPESVDETEDFSNFGIDSISGSRIHLELIKHYKNMDDFVLLEHNSIKKLADHIYKTYYATPMLDAKAKTMQLEKTKQPVADLSEVGDIIQLLSQEKIDSVKELIPTQEFISSYEANGGKQKIELKKIKLANNFQLEVVMAGVGEPILFLPPFNSTAIVWINQILSLSKYFQVIVIHYPGTGHSDWIEELHTFSDLAKVIISAIDTLHLHKIIRSTAITLVGWSFGGFLAQTMAAEYQDYICKLILISTTVISWSSKEYNISGEQFSLRSSEQFRQNYARLPAFIRKMPSVKTLYAKDKIEAFVLGTRNTNVINRYFLMIAKFRHTNIAEQIKIKTYLISGGKDDLMPAQYARKLHHLISGSEYFEVEEGEHFMSLFNKEIINKKLFQWLKEVATIERNFSKVHLENLIEAE